MSSRRHYQRGGLGDVKVKKFLNKILQEELEPIRNRRKAFEKDIPYVFDVLREGSAAAQTVAADTLSKVKHAMRIDYFADENFVRAERRKYNNYE